MSCDSAIGGIVRNTKEAHTLQLCANYLLSVHECEQEPGSRCQHCFDVLSSVIKMTHESTAVVANLIRKILDYQRIQNTYNMEKIRNLLFNISECIREYIDLYGYSMKEFNRRKATDSRLYRQNHIESSVSARISMMNCTVENMYETGEVYPNLPLVRPRVILREKKEEAELCTKHYKNNMTHSPGIFTVQCTCISPKLLGVIAMDRNEGDSTALNSILT